MYRIRVLHQRSRLCRKKCTEESGMPQNQPTFGTSSLAFFQKKDDISLRLIKTFLPISVFSRYMGDT